MGLLSFPPSGADVPTASGGLPGVAQPVSGAQAPTQASVSGEQKWINALAVLSAALKDAGAYMQHRPEAADNLSSLVRQRNAALQASAFAPVLPGLPPHVVAAGLLHAALQRASAQPPNPGAGPQSGVAADPNGGWTIERVK